MINIGDMIIDFELPSDNGNLIKLSDFNNKNVILYFYSKDNTSGCTCQALGYRDLYTEFNKLNTEIIGISKDNIESHKKFKEKNKLPFILLSDINLDVISKYDLYKEKNMYGKKVMGVIRTSIIIQNGIIKEINYKVKSKDDAINNLEYLKKSMNKIF